MLLCVVCREIYAGDPTNPKEVTITRDNILNLVNDEPLDPEVLIKFDTYLMQVYGCINFLFLHLIFWWFTCNNLYVFSWWPYVLITFETALKILQNISLGPAWLIFKHRFVIHILNYSTHFSIICFTRTSTYRIFILQMFVQENVANCMERGEEVKTDIHSKVGLWEPLWPIFHRPHVLIPIFHHEWNHYSLLEIVTQTGTFKHHNCIVATGHDNFKETAEQIVSKIHPFNSKLYW